MAIGLAVGLAFAGGVQTFVDDLIMPLVAATFGKPSFDGLRGHLNGMVITYGKFLTVPVGLLLLALVILLLVKLIKRLTGKESAGAQGNRECDFCNSFIPVDASVCMYYTRDIEPVVA